MPWPGPPLWVCRVWKVRKKKSSRCSVSPWLYCQFPSQAVRYLLLLLLPMSFSFSEIRGWQISMLSSKWQSTKTSIKLLIEETVECVGRLCRVRSSCGGEKWQRLVKGHRRPEASPTALSLRAALLWQNAWTRGSKCILFTATYFHHTF